MSSERAVIIALVLVGTLGSAHAQGRFTDNSDIVGIRLNMSRIEVRKALEKDFAISKLEEPKTSLRSPNYTTPEIVVAHIYDITPKEEVAVNAEKEQEGVREVQRMTALRRGRPIRSEEPSEDKIKISLDPNANSTGIFAIKRKRAFRKGDRPTQKVFMDAVKEKYGEPTTNSSLAFIWSTINFPPRRQGEDPYFAYIECDNIMGLAIDGDIQLVNLSNRINEFKAKGSRCGSMLRLSYRIDSDKFVSDFEISMA